MEASKRQLEFFAFIIWIAVLTAAAILIIDFQIKGAILDQVTNFRRQYEEWQSGQAGKATASKRPDNHRNNDVAYPGDMVAGRDASVETAGHNGAPYEPGSAGTARQAKRRTANGPGQVSDGSE